MIDKLLYSALLLLAIPFIYAGLAIVFAVSMAANAVNALGRILQ